MYVCVSVWGGVCGCVMVGVMVCACVCDGLCDEATIFHIFKNF